LGFPSTKNVAGAIGDDLDVLAAGVLDAHEQIHAVPRISSASWISSAW
jgi:hypothetical protein